MKNIHEVKILILEITYLFFKLIWFFELAIKEIIQDDDYYIKNENIDQIEEIANVESELEETSLFENKNPNENETKDNQSFDQNPSLNSKKSFK